MEIFHKFFSLKIIGHPVPPPPAVSTDESGNFDSSFNPANKRIKLSSPNNLFPQPKTTTNSFSSGISPVNVNPSAEIITNDLLLCSAPKATFVQTKTENTATSVEDAAVKINPPVSISSTTNAMAPRMQFWNNNNNNPNLVLPNSQIVENNNTLPSTLPVDLDPYQPYAWYVETV